MRRADGVEGGDGRAFVLNMSVVSPVSPYNLVLRLGGLQLKQWCQSLLESASVFCLALPNDDGAKTMRFELSPSSGVARDVRRELLHPEVTVAGGRGSSRTSGMAMPEAAVDEDREPQPTVREVWSAGESPDIAAVAEVPRAEPCGYSFLGGSLRLANTAHQVGPLGRRHARAALEGNQRLIVGSRGHARIRYLGGTGAWSSLS